MAGYEKRLIRVIQYIHDFPDGDLSLDALADVAAMSRFHWHRVFRAMTGETCAAAVKRIRMHRAANALVHGNASIAEIAASVGYPQVASFSRAFGDVYRMAPAAFRAAGRDAPMPVSIRKGEPVMAEVEVRETAERRLVALEHRGAYPEIGRAFQSLYASIGARGMFGKIGKGVAVYLDDPFAKPVDELRSYAGIELQDGVEVPEGMEGYTIPSGRVAVLTYKGAYAGLPMAWNQIYADWLPTSGEEPGDVPSYEVYLNDPTNTAPQDLLTEIVVPLK